MSNPPLNIRTGAKLLLATSNRGKLDELRRQLKRAQALIEVVSPDEVEAGEPPEETGTTFAENARLKALHYAETTGLVALADDSGLEVDALNGRPGVHSARYGSSPEDGIRRLLEELADVPPGQRSARFRCAMALAVPGEGIIAESDGCIEGAIARSASGTGGFGYDPIFIVISDPENRHMAELSPDEKQAISHRGRALRMILPAVIGLFA
jgi:XTP/dITP diphosphohydrolase